MARRSVTTRPLAGETEWLGQVREVRHPINLSHPLRVKRRFVTHGGLLPQPSCPFPERHPYCEINFSLEGEGEQFIGMGKTLRTPGDLMLIGPGVPHYGTMFNYPSRAIIVYFLPVLLFELSPGEGARFLARFTANQSISRQVVMPPKALQAKFAAQFESMADEFAHPKLGSDLSARARLMDILVGLLRWEKSAGKVVPQPSASSHWSKIEKTLHFIYQHYSEPLYIEQIAREVGLSIDRLYKLFHDAFGMGCIQYLNAYRISQAAAFLCLPDARVTEVAASVGFETLSHFNTSFRRYQGVSPTEYIRLQKAAK